MIYSNIMQQFIARHALDGLSEQTLKQVYAGEFSIDKAQCYIDFYDRLEGSQAKHPLIINNPYLSWFKDTHLTDNNVRHFLVQFSVFNNQFQLAQLQKMLSAPTLKAMHIAKEALINHLGVSFNISATQNQSELKDYHEGQIEGGRFYFSTAQFEQLLEIATWLDLSFEEMGNRIHGISTTLFFCDELIRCYSSTDNTTLQAASFATESWLSCDFWQDIIQGLQNYKMRRGINLPLNFFISQQLIAQQKKKILQKNLETYYFSSEVNEDLFIEIHDEILNTIYTFWKGLNDDRHRIH